MEKVRAEGPRRRLVGLRVDSPEAMLWGGALILRDGVAAGQVTSAAWGEAAGACVGLAYVWDPAGKPVDVSWLRAGSYLVNVGGELFAIRIALKALYDPTNERIRS